MPVFSDCQFIESLKELDNPVLDEYELFVELSGIKVYRKFIEVKGIYSSMLPFKFSHFLFFHFVFLNNYFKLLIFILYIILHFSKYLELHIIFLTLLLLTILFLTLEPGTVPSCEARYNTSIFKFRNHLYMNTKSLENLYQTPTFS